MLRKVHTAHFASHHSPTREKRELLFAIDDKKRLTDGLPEGSETGEADASDGLTNVERAVAAGSNSIHARTLVRLPEALADIPEKAHLLDSVILGGSVELNFEANRLARRLKIDLAKATDAQKQDVFNELMTEPTHALSIARVIDGRLNSHEQLRKLIDERLKTIARGSKNKAVEDIEQLRGLIQQFQTEDDSLSRQDLMKKVIQKLDPDQELLSLGKDDHLKEKMIVDMLVVLEDTLKGDFKRTTFMHPNNVVPDKKRELDDARKEYLDTLRRQADGTKDFLDASLQQRAQKVFDGYGREHDQYAENTNGQTMEKGGLTAEGVVEAFRNGSTVALNVTRRNPDAKAAAISPKTGKYDPRLDANMPATHDADYLIRAEGALNELNRAERQLKVAIHTPDDRVGTQKFAAKGIDESIFMRDMRLNEERNEMLGYEIGGEIDKLMEIFAQRNERNEPGAKEALAFLQQRKEIFGAFGHEKKPGEPTLQQRTTMRLMPFSKLDETLKTLKDLENAPDLLARLAEANKNFTDAPGANTNLVRGALGMNLDTASQTISGYLKHDVCETLHLPKQLEALYGKIRINLATADEYEGKDRGNHAFAFAKTQVDILQDAAKQLQKLYTDPSVVKRMGVAEFAATGASPDTDAFYDERTGLIVINTDVCVGAAEEAAALEHERGHAVLDILKRRAGMKGTDVKAGIFPDMLSELHERLKTQARDKGISLDDLMSRQADKWNCKRDGKIDIDDFMDELVVQHADWKKGRKEQPSADELALFSLFEEAPEPDLQTPADSPDEFAIDTSGKKKYRTRGGGGGEDEEVEVNADGTVKEEPPNYRKELQKLDTDIHHIERFLDVYKEQNKDPAVGELLASLKQNYATAKKAFDEGLPESEFGPVLKQAKAQAKVFTDEIKKIDVARMDLTDAAPSQKKGWRSLFDPQQVQWLCIYDIGKIFKDGWEDISRMWKRRSEQARAAVGKNMFGLIPAGIPYAGQLAREFQGREQSSEQEEVGVWEKRYEKIDSHKLLHEILPYSNHKDEVKAIINLLTKRGRMDWNFSGLWDKLEALGKFHIPHDACRRDILLRDMYMQKLIANIWTDQDLFEHWKNDNDSNIQSGKSHWQATIDTLSGTRGGLAGRCKYLLEKQLVLENHGHLPPEEEVNPHLYEGILHYAMRNGKMSLEDKIFYLIQGVAHGLLSIDRMKGLLGEQGEILNSFPFIDFFNGKTMADVQRMANKLGYAEKTLEPDFRTTDFILAEIANDEGARQRATKALKNAQNIDHEDMPGLISMLDHQGITSMVSVYSGNQPKLSAQGQANIYVGYNTLLQYYAIRAKYAKKAGKKAIFSNDDARRLAVSLAGYVHFDNITTQAAVDGTRPFLSWDRIKNDEPVSDRAGKKTGEYRQRLNDFMYDLTQRVNIPEVNGIETKKYLGKFRVDAATSKEHSPGGEKSGEQVFKATTAFVDQLTRQIMANKDSVQDMLAEMADKDITHGGFIPEANNESYTYDNVSKVIEDDGRRAPVAHH